MNIIYTVCNRTNLTHALTLAESAFEHQPDHTFYLCWVDSLPLTHLQAHVNILSIADANILKWRDMERQYTDFELLAACRPWFALELLRRHADCKQMTFLSPTVILVRPYDEILNTESTIFLTPNIVKPLASSRFLDDKRILNIGMFHSGSWILIPGKETLRILQWWAERTLDRAKFDLCEGMNMDQLWLNYVPLWIQQTSIVRNPGWHYGLHAVLGHTLSFEHGIYKVDNNALISIDFAGLDFFDPIWSDYAALLSGNPAFKELFRTYRESLKKNEIYKPVGNAQGYGKVIKIKKLRVLRNNIAKKLTSLAEYIDQF